MTETINLRTSAILLPSILQILQIIAYPSSFLPSFLTYWMDTRFSIDGILGERFFYEAVLYIEE